MQTRPELFDAMPQSCGNIRYYGLYPEQRVRVKTPSYTGWAIIKGEPPQGTGIYVLATDGRQLWVSGEDIVEATKPTFTGTRG